MFLRAVVALGATIGSGVLLATACDAPVIETPCPALDPGSYTLHLAYAGEFTFDGGCAGARAFDGQTVTVSFADGSAGVKTPTGAVSCTATSDYSGVSIQCPLPTGNELQVTLVGTCGGADASVRAYVQLLILQDGDASPGTVEDPLCTSTYEAT